MIDVKSCKDINGNRIRLGDRVRYRSTISTHTPEHLSGFHTVTRIQKAGYFIQIHLRDLQHPWYMPKLCAERVIPS